MSIIYTMNKMLKQPVYCIAHKGTNNIYYSSRELSSLSLEQFSRDIGDATFFMSETEAANVFEAIYKSLDEEYAEKLVLVKCELNLTNYDQLEVEDMITAIKIKHLHNERRAAAQRIENIDKQLKEIGDKAVDPIERCNGCDNNPALPNHTCPFKTEIHGNYEFLCNCCKDCQYECAMEI